MKLQLQITEAGQKLVETTAFAVCIKDSTADMEDAARQATLFSLVAWALTGRDINQPPQSADELAAFAAFIQTYRPQIQAASDVCAKNLMDLISGGNIH
jgi:hypothetical protein